MKINKILFLALITISFISCGTSHNYTNNNLDKNFYEGKTIYFKLNPRSKNAINFTGMVVSVGGLHQPNVKETFKESIDELAAETNLKLKFIENSDEINNNDVLIIDSDISEINWHFGFSTATLKTTVKYKNINDNTEVSTTGTRKSGGGNEKNNLRKSLKNAIYNFLKELEKQKR